MVRRALRSRVLERMMWQRIIDGARTRYEDAYAALLEGSVRAWQGDVYMASYLTASAFAGAMIMNVAFAIGLVRAVFGPATVAPATGIIPGLAVVAIFLTMAYVLLLREDRYYAHLDRFRSKSATYRRRTTIVTWSYLALSYLCPIVFFAALALSDPRASENGAIPGDLFGEHASVGSEARAGGSRAVALAHARPAEGGSPWTDFA